MIPDEAVNAAVKYLAEKFNWNGELLPVTAREVLEVAGPFIAAEAMHRGYVAALDQAADKLDTLWYERKERMYEQRDWADGVEESEALVKKMLADKKLTDAV